MALPHTLLIPEGSRGGAIVPICGAPGVGLCFFLFVYMKEGQNAVHFFGVVFV